MLEVILQQQNDNMLEYNDKTIMSIQHYIQCSVKIFKMQMRNVNYNKANSRLMKFDQNLTLPVFKKNILKNDIKEII